MVSRHVENFDFQTSTSGLSNFFEIFVKSVPILTDVRNTYYMTE
jgi:hypothetical protein